jgi:hypothetical protein
MFPSEGAIKDSQHNIKLKCLATYSIFYETLFELYVNIFLIYIPIHILPTIRIMSEMILTRLLHVRNIAHFTFRKSKTLYIWHTMYTRLPQPKYYVVILQLVPNVV